MPKGFARVAAASLPVHLGDVAANEQEILSAMEPLRRQGVQLAVFPELCLTASWESMLRIAEKTDSSMAVVIGLPVNVRSRLYNCAAVLYGGRPIGFVPKTYLPNGNEFYETRWFVSGAEADETLSCTLPGGEVCSALLRPDQLFDLGGFTFGVEICEDLWTPIPPSCQLAVDGADVIVNPSASNALVSKHQYRRELLSQQSGRLYAGYAYAGAGFGESTSDLVFDGYTAVYEESRDDDSKEEKEGTLPPLVEGQGLTLEAYTPLQHFTQPPARYTDATLIRAMEQNGIGRPSTYAPTVSTILDREYVIKDGKYLRPTPLGEVVTGLMEERFPDIVDMKFTARMEEKLDTVEEGKTAWKDVIRDFYGGFERDLENAEKALEGVRLKVPDEVSEEKCDVCGRNMVIKSGRFGRFLACPGYPECTFTKPLVIEMPGRCPKCGGRMMKRTGVSKKTNKQYTYYACEFATSSDPEKKCDFMTWDVPTKNDCPECGQTMFKKAGKGFKRPYCINPACSRFVPEDQRGYVKKKTTETAEEGAESAEAADAAETAEKKTAARKTTAKKSTTAKKTSTKAASTKETATKTAAAKKTTKKAAAEDGAEKPAKKTAAKKTATTKKAAAKKTTAKSAAKKTAEKEEN